MLLFAIFSRNKTLLDVFILSTFANSYEGLIRVPARGIVSSQKLGLPQLGLPEFKPRIDTSRSLTTLVNWSVACLASIELGQVLRQ